MYQEFELNNWNRRSTYEFFKDYEDPFFNLRPNLDVTELYRFCKTNNLSFSLAGLFFSQSAVNSMPEFRVRYLHARLVQFDQVEATQTILNSDETFSFCYFANQPILFEYDRAGRIAREKYLGLRTLDVQNDRVDLIYYSVIPWVSFTSFKHAGLHNNRQTVPRVVFGKTFDQNSRSLMPVSVEVHHAMMDGVHVGKYYTRFQELISTMDVTE